MLIMFYWMAYDNFCLYLSFFSGDMISYFGANVEADALQKYVNHISSAPIRLPNHSSEYPWASCGPIINFDSVSQDCGNSKAHAVELLRLCVKTVIFYLHYTSVFKTLKRSVNKKFPVR